MNVAVAVSWEVWPVAVAWNVAPIKFFGEDVPACVEFAVLVGYHLPRFERLLDGVCFDHNHVHGFAGLESAAVEIDIGKRRVILAIGGEGWLLVRLLALLG